MSGKITQLEDIKIWLDSHGVTNYEITPDLIVNVNKGVFLNNQSLTQIPVQFGIVNGDFDCAQNNLINLEGSPRIVKGHYYCSHNQIRSLKGAPEVVEGAFTCGPNEKLVSLEGISHTVHRSVSCSETPLKVLDYVPASLLGSFTCRSVPLENIDNLKNCQFKGIFIHSCTPDSLPIEALKEFYDDHNTLIIQAQSMNAYFLMQKLSEKSETQTKKKKL